MSELKTEKGFFFAVLFISKPLLIKGALTIAMQISWKKLEINGIK